MFLNNNFASRHFVSPTLRAGSLVSQIASGGLFLPGTFRSFFKTSPAFFSAVGVLTLGMVSIDAQSQAQTYLASASGNSLSGSAGIGGCGTACPGGLNAQNLGGPGHGSITFNNIAVPASGLYTISVRYDNGTGSNLPIAFSANGGAAVTVNSPSTGSWNVSTVETVTLSLRAGPNNIMLSGVGTQYAAEVCSLTLPSSLPPPSPTPPPPPPPLPPNTVSLTIFGSVGTGGDDTNVFAQAIQATATARETLHVPAGTYHVRPLRLPSNTNLLLDAGATVQATSAGYSAGGQVMLDFTGSSDVTIVGTPGQSGFKMLKAQYTDGSEYRHCMNIVNTNNVKISGIFCNDSGGDGAYIAGSSSNITLTKDTFNNNSRNGLSIISVNGLLVDGCTFSNTVGNPNGGSAPGGPWDGIDIEPNGPRDQTHSITIQNSTFKGNGLPLPSGNGLCSHCGNAITVAVQRLDGTSSPVSITMTNLTSSGNLGSGYFLTAGVSSTPMNGTVTLQNSSSNNDGQWGIVCYFCEYASGGLSELIQNNTIMNPMQGYNTHQPLMDAGLAMAGGGGEALPAGNVTIKGTSVIYTSGADYPAYFDIGPTNPAGTHAIVVNSFGTTTGLRSGHPFGLLQGMAVTSVNIP